MIGTSVLFLVNTIIQRGLGRWTTDAQYSSKSCYEFLFQGQSYQDLGDLTGAHGPPEGQVPHLAGLPRSMLDRREIGAEGAPTPTTLPACDQAEETMDHLLVGCPFSRTVWHEVLSWVQSTARPPRRGDDFVEWWHGATQSTPPVLYARGLCR
jgi:hypothetical protein